MIQIVLGALGTFLKRPEKRLGGTRHQSNYRDYPDHSAVKNSENTSKFSGGKEKLAVSQTTMKLVVSQTPFKFAVSQTPIKLVAFKTPIKFVVFQAPIKFAVS